jgi:hypothetical protein
MLAVSRKVIEVNRSFHPDGKRFLVKSYPGQGGHRRPNRAPDRREARAHIEDRSLSLGDLLFAADPRD